MTTTEPETLDGVRAERLARLRERRSAAPSMSASDPAPTPEPATAEPTADAQPTAAPESASVAPTASVRPTRTPDQPTELDPARSERLARLGERGATAPPARSAGPSATMSDATPDIVHPAPAAAAPGAVSSGRRRGPATSAKIVTAGVSATALLGMIAGYGFADGRSSPAIPALDEPAPPPATAPTPPMIVVVVDGTTGQVTASSDGRPADAATAAIAAIPATAGVAARAAADGTSPPPGAVPSAAAPSPVPVPVAVELAVPAPPAPAAAPSAAPAAPPPPQATSDGS